MVGGLGLENKSIRDVVFFSLYRPPLTWGLGPGLRSGRGGEGIWVQSRETGPRSGTHTSTHTPRTLTVEYK